MAIVIKIITVDQESLSLKIFCQWAGAMDWDLVFTL